MGLAGTLIDKGYFVKINSRIIHNYQIAEFYENLYVETGKESYQTKSVAIFSCCKCFDIDYYRKQGIKDVKRVNLCRDKFCLNCQSVLAIQRMLKYAPILESYRNDYMVCHMVVSVPNCEPEELLPVLNKMYKKFPFLMRYFKGEAKVKGIDFLKYGYGGAVRSLEVTQNQRTKQMHPHFHCMVLFDKNIDLTLKHKNSFSYRQGQFYRKYAYIEVLIQKIWFLLMNDCKVTSKAISDLKEGYSVTVQDSEGYYHECFKYACKGAFDFEKGAFIYKEPIFRILYYSLFKRHIIQGYGKLHKFKDIDNEIFEDNAIEAYINFIAKLRAVEKPYFYVASLDDMISDKNCKYISKSSFLRVLGEFKTEIIERAKSADLLDDIF